MAGFEPEGAAYYTNQDLQEDYRSSTQENAQVKKDLEQFLRSYSETGSDSFPYRDQLRRNLAKQNDRYSIQVDMEDLAAWKEPLAAKLRQNPDQYLPLFEEAAQRFFFTFVSTEDPEALANLKTKERVQLQIATSETATSLRELQSRHVSHLVTVSGIIISASSIQSKASKLFCRCTTCGDVQEIDVKLGMGGAKLPRTCPGSRESGCALDPYTIDPDLCTYQDVQKFKLQELPEAVPTGEMPRNILLAADRALVGTAIPGTRVTVTGVYSVVAPQGRGGDRGGSTVSQPYLRVVGVNVDAEGRRLQQPEFSKQEEENFIAMSRDRDIYDKIGQSIAPAIYGHPDIKRALACSLFAGSRKRLRDGMRLRGDINVLLLGDPSTAKSQLLKFIEKVAPIAVYTSGKGSSAAGLTATVIRGQGGEFYLEGGAMVMADGGVVCIDEFDKMRAQDRVAIHEAMEQQTISIAKAGISTVLNSRAAVVAAANPKFGSFDDSKDPHENIEFQSTILSRFDTIFIVRDDRNEEKDQRLSKYVMDMHAKAAVPTETVEGPVPVPLLKRYITYCRARCSPRLSPAAANLLKDHYVKVRQSTVGAGRDPDAPAPAIPITVRQLESLARLSEAVAKMRLMEEVLEEHVREAIRLFEVSTLAASSSGMMADLGGYVDPDTLEEIQRCEEQIRQRIPRGDGLAVSRLENDLLSLGRSDFVVRKAIETLVRRDELRYEQQRRTLKRVA